jgi:hypothetical protein
MSEKTTMLLTAIASILCAVWGVFAEAYAMTAAMIFNAVVSFVLAFKLGKMR